MVEKDKNFTQEAPRAGVRISGGKSHRIRIHRRWTGYTL